MRLLATNHPGGPEIFVADTAIGELPPNIGRVIGRRVDQRIFGSEAHIGEPFHFVRDVLRYRTASLPVGNIAGGRPSRFVIFDFGNAGGGEARWEDGRVGEEWVGTGKARGL